MSHNIKLGQQKLFQNVVVVSFFLSNPTIDGQSSTREKPHDSKNLALLGCYVEQFLPSFEG